MRTATVTLADFKDSFASVGIERRHTARTLMTAGGSLASQELPLAFVSYTPT